jgi:glycosyltransferase involved in cell wall biosynthesis
MEARRIVFYIDSLKLGGAERVLLQWARWCRDGDWSVVVLTRRSADHDAYPLPEGVERWLEPADPGWLSALGWWGFPVRVVRLRQRLRLGKFQVAVGVTTLPAVKLLMASRGLNLICLVSERNYPPAKPPALPWRWLRRVTYPWADRHLVQTRRTGDWLRQHCGARRQVLLPNPVVWPLPDQAPRLEPDALLPPAAPLLLAAGTKAHQKGFDRLVAVFRRLAGRWPELRLVILGLPATPYHGIDQQAWLRAVLGDPALQDRLLLPGRAGNLSSWYRRASLFALPSRYEGFPNVLLEAMAAGCACVAADCPTGPAELIRPGIDGILLPESAAPELWAATLDSLLASPEERQRLGDAALAVRERFDAAALGQRFLTTLTELTSNG